MPKRYCLNLNKMTGDGTIALLDPNKLNSLEDGDIERAKIIDFPKSQLTLIATMVGYANSGVSAMNGEDGEPDSHEHMTAMGKVISEIDKARDTGSKSGSVKVEVSDGDYDVSAERKFRTTRDNDKHACGASQNAHELAIKIIDTFERDKTEEKIAEEAIAMVFGGFLGVSDGDRVQELLGIMRTHRMMVKAKDSPAAMLLKIISDMLAKRD